MQWMQQKYEEQFFCQLMQVHAKSLRMQNTSSTWSVNFTRLQKNNITQKQKKLENLEQTIP